MIFFIVALVFYFRQKKEMNRAHKSTVDFLENSIGGHFKQIHKRSARLNTYDFIKYNLTDALLVQPEILL